MSEQRRAVVLLSGGLDSATVLAIARGEGYDAYALSFAYGQRHSWELVCAAHVASSLGVREHRVAAIDLRVFGGSALTADLNVGSSTRLFQVIPVFKRAVYPAMRPLQTLQRLVVGIGVECGLIKRHDDVGAESSLYFHCALGRQPKGLTGCEGAYTCPLRRDSLNW